MEEVGREEGSSRDFWFLYFLYFFPWCRINSQPRKLLVYIELEDVQNFLLYTWGWQIDPAESRYLLAGAANGSVGAYDTQQGTSFDPVLNISKHEALFTVDKSIPQGHRFSVSSVQWYPIDTGLFITGSFDKNINLWDTNTLQVHLLSRYFQEPILLIRTLCGGSQNGMLQRFFSLRWR